MRDIKFRGYSNECKKWFYGSLLIDEIQKSYCIIDNEEGIGREVILETIGQYTGLKDKNGKEIYEGDIVKINDEIITQVIWDKDYLGYFLYANEENSIEYFENGEQPLYDYWESIEVIGNIHDNKELLDTE